MPVKNADNTLVLELIAKRLIKRKEKVAIAESVTSGDVQSAFSSAKNALQFFQGGITVYNVIQKVRHLQVDPVHAMACNCVSAVIAEDMAKNVIKLFASDWGIGITGYATPVPEKGIKELFAFVAIYFKEKCMLSELLTADKLDAELVRQFYTHHVLLNFSKAIQKSH